MADRTSLTEMLPPPARVAVVLAGGGGGPEGLGPRTGTGSSALHQVGGMPIVERTVRMLLAEGVERVVVIADEDATAVAGAAQRPDKDRVEVLTVDGRATTEPRHLAIAEAAVAGEERLVLVSSDVVFTDGALSSLVRSSQPAALVEPGTGRFAGAFMVGPSMLGALPGIGGDTDGGRAVTEAVWRTAAERGAREVPLPPGTASLSVATPEDLPAAGRMLRRSLIKPTDGPVSRYLNRSISTRISMALAPFRLSPDSISVVAGILGVAAGWALAWGRGLLGGLLIQASTIIDGVDGETSRLQIRSSPRGAAFDAVIDRIVDGSLVAGVALWLWPFHPSLEFKVGILASSAYGWGFISYVFQRRLTGLEVTGQEHSLIMLLGGRDSRLLVLSIGVILYHPGAAVAVGWAVYLSSVSLRVFLTRRRAGAPPGPVASPDQVGDPAQGDLGEER